MSGARKGRPGSARIDYMMTVQPLLVPRRGEETLSSTLSVSVSTTIRTHSGSMAPRPSTPSWRPAVRTPCTAPSANSCATSTSGTAARSSAPRPALMATIAPRLAGYIRDEARAAMHAGVPVAGVCLYPIANFPNWDDDRHLHNGLLGLPGQWRRASGRSTGRWPTRCAASRATSSRSRSRVPSIARTARLIGRGPAGCHNDQR